jgi:hypothetical protein
MLRFHDEELLIDHLRYADHDQDELDAMLAIVLAEKQLVDSDEEIEPTWGCSRPGSWARFAFLFPLQQPRAVS